MIDLLQEYNVVNLKWWINMYFLARGRLSIVELNGATYILSKFNKRRKKNNIKIIILNNIVLLTPRPSCRVQNCILTINMSHNLLRLPWSIITMCLSWVHIFQADIYVACSFSIFSFVLSLSFFFLYVDRNDATELNAKISHVSLERCILWNGDKIINLCSFMRYYSSYTGVMHWPALSSCRSYWNGETINRYVALPWLLKISVSLSILRWIIRWIYCSRIFLIPNIDFSMW